MIRATTGQTLGDEGHSRHPLPQSALREHRISQYAAKALKVSNLNKPPPSQHIAEIL